MAFTLKSGNKPMISKFFGVSPVKNKPEEMATKETENPPPDVTEESNVEEEFVNYPYKNWGMTNAPLANSPVRNYKNPQDYKVFNMGNKPTPVKKYKKY